MACLDLWILSTFDSLGKSLSPRASVAMATKVGIIEELDRRRVAALKK
jgi:hypothetical protein